MLWGAAMLWSAAVSNFDELLLARLFLGAVTAAAGPLVASLVGDYFGGNERGRIYGFILTGELLGAGFGFAVTGDIAALSWRAAFVILALPAFALAWLVFRLPEPKRGGGGVLARHGAPVEPDEPGLPHETDAQRLARERGLVPDPELVIGDAARRLYLIEATRYVLKIRTNIFLIASSACGYYFLAGVQTFGSEFAKEQYGINQALANLLLLVIGVGAVGGVLAGGAAGDALLHRGRLNGRITTAAVDRGADRDPVHPGAPDPERRHRRAVPDGGGADALGAEPATRRRPPRHHAAAPLGSRRGGPHAAALARAGARAAALRRRLRPRLRRRPLGPPVDVRRDARPARRERLAALPRAAHVPVRRRHRRRGPAAVRVPCFAMSAAFLVASAFLASAVEMVEALTIVLAAGLARGWRSSLTGVGAATVALAVVVAALGPALTVVPLNALRLVVGSLLLVFGLQWLRKAILRASGFKALHDEDAIFARELDEARAVEHVERAGLDWYGFTLSFKGVFLEGLEVAFIVLTFGSTQGSIPLAAIGAAAALVLVAGVGIAVRAPLARVPENSMKFAVGIMLTTFGIFWGAEGAGAHWPGSDASLPGVLAFVCASSALLVALLRRQRRTTLSRGGGGGVSRIAAFGRFWWDFVVGDDWLAAVGVAVAIGATAALAAENVAAWWLLPPAVVLVLYVSLQRAIRQ